MTEPTLFALVMVLAEPISWAVIASGLAQNAIYTIQLLLAYRHLARRSHFEAADDLWRQYAEVAPPISLLVPAYNEQATIVESVRSLLALRYPHFEVIVINDGSRDGTLDAIISGFGLRPAQRSWDQVVPHQAVHGIYGNPAFPSLLVVDKDNGGKADALNAGINISRMPLFCAVDADSVLESDALLRCVEPFVDAPEETIAVGGTIRLANGCTVVDGQVVRVGLPTTLLPLFQTMEYLRAFLMGRLAWSEMRAVTLISGAFGIFRRDAAIEVNGYRHDTVGEDFEIIVKLHRAMIAAKRPYAVRFVPEPVCWTEAPSSLAVLRRQRVRWQRGALETFFRHRAMVLNPRYGRIGLLGFGHMLIVDVLGPPLEALGYVLLPLLWLVGLLDAAYPLAFFSLTCVFGIFISVSSLILEELELRRFPRASDLAILFLIAVLENFGYRQLNTLWRIEGWWRFLRGTRGQWGAMTRQGFSRCPADPPSNRQD
jgi:cellulose synthase/poly-beta-1,6-N-acetylglucosamine synthase-like glycosyltransferase